MIMAAGFPLHPHHGGIPAEVRERFQYPPGNRPGIGSIEISVRHETPAAREGAHQQGPQPLDGERPLGLRVRPELPIVCR